MNIKRKILIITIIFIALAMLSFYSFKNRRETRIDVVAVNDIVHSIIAQWDELKQSELPGLSYGLDYVVLDTNEVLIAATKEGLNTSLNQAISNRDTIVDIKKWDKEYGKLIIFNDTKTLWEKYQNDLFTYTLIMLSLVGLWMISYIIYLDKKILYPFRKLRSFAGHVAKGKLDLPLDMDKSNLFGAFTESFDLMRDELNKSRENERKANQSKKELVASLSHDIKTPVASIKAVTDIMYAKSEDDYIRKQLITINAKADQINTLIMNLFSATLEELQELKVNVTEQPSLILYDLIKNADYLNQVTITGIPECIVLIDELRIAQVIDNIISNSYKYAGTSIVVTTHVKGKYLELRWKDFGPGVSEDERPLLCHKFYRAENAANKSGAGLGLYISKYLIDKMSGEIDCENVEDGFVTKIKLLLA